MPPLPKRTSAALFLALVALGWIPAAAQRLPETSQPASTPVAEAGRILVQTPQSTSQTPSGGTVKQNSKDGLRYVWIPPGTFMMGCSPGDSGCDSSEKPSHQVSITKGFWFGQTPVTVEAYKRFASATGQQMPSAPNFNSNWTNDNMPIVDVSWNDSQAYCQWAGGRLPTEAEWEYAARAESTEARYGPPDDVAWYSSNSGGRTHDVAEKRANGFGLYDTLGNVSQWVNDWYDPHYYQSSPSQDPAGPGSGQYRVLRGGSWIYPPSGVRVTDRYYFEPARWIYIGGFRCVGDTTIRATLAEPAQAAAPAQPAPRVETPGSTPQSPSGGTVLQNSKDGLKYVWIPPGSFMMGCSPGDSECDSNEKPSHQVSFTKGFWFGQTPVTVEAYKRFTSATGQQMSSAPSFNSNWTDDNMPIVNVNWDDSQTYCQWAGGRLPTEAEWEYAARGGSTEARYGSIDKVAWYYKNNGRRTQDVARKRANGFGLYDTLGNVWEWVNDWYDSNYYQSSPSTDPAGPGSGQFRVLRGGSFYDLARYVRVSVRNYVSPWTRGNLFGIRCVGEANIP